MIPPLLDKLTQQNKKKPRICIVGPLLGKNPGWVVSQGEILAEQLRREGYEVLATSFIVNPYIRTLDMINSILAWRNKINVIILTVFSGRGFIVAEIMSYLAKYLKETLLITLRGGGLPGFSEIYPKRVRRVLSRADVLISPSEYLADFFSKIGFEVEVIPNIIIIKNYIFKQRSTMAPRLLWMRTFEDRYNPMMAIEVLAELITVYPQAILTMAGQETGQERGLLDSLKKAVHKKGLSKNARFAGFLNLAKKQREFAAHDIFLNTTHVDNMPVSLLEAAAFGLPIITTKVGGIPFLFKDNETALFVEDADVPGMVSQVKRLLDNKDLTGKLSYNGRKLAEGCDWGFVKPKWEGIFQRIS